MALRLDRKSLVAFEGRTKGISARSQPRWGKFRPEQMLAHLHRNLELALGEFTAPDESTWFRRAVLRPIVFDSGLPWPKGKVQAPDFFLPAPAGEVEDELDRILPKMVAFADLVEREPDRVVLSPIFGPAPLKYWSKMVGKHFDHHLRQFGV